MGKSVYITGKVGKHPDKVKKDRFARMKEILEKQGFEKFVFPVYLNAEDIEMTKDQAIIQDIKNMLDCDTLYLDNNWSHSKRSVLLRNLALSLQKDIIYHH